MSCVAFSPAFRRPNQMQLDQIDSRHLQDSVISNRWRMFLGASALLSVLCTLLLLGRLSVMQFGLNDAERASLMLGLVESGELMLPPIVCLISVMLTLIDLFCRRGLPIKKAIVSALLIVACNVGAVLVYWIVQWRKGAKRASRIGL